MLHIVLFSPMIILFYYEQTKLAKPCEAISEVMLTVYYWFELSMERDLEK